MRKYFALCLLFLIASVSFADTAGTLANDIGVLVPDAISYIQSFGGQAWLLKVSSVIMLMVAVVKVTPLNALWISLGSRQIWLAPVLGLIWGVVSLAAGGTPLTAGAILAYVTAGAGAVFLHELLDLVKVIPGLGPFWVSIITVIENTLGGSAPVTAQAKVNTK